MKRGDRVLVDTSGWSESSVQRAQVVRVGQASIGIVWETGELAGREATVAREHLRVVEVLT